MSAPGAQTISGSDLAATWTDLHVGIAHWRLWGRLGWLEVRRRYRRTVLGPFWTTLSLAILVITMGYLWAGLWSTPTPTYLPYLCSGMVAWILVQAIVLEGCSVFNSQEALIKQLRCEFTVLCLAVVWRNLIVFAHNLIVFVIVLPFSEVHLGPATLLVVPGLVLVALNGLWIVALFGILSSRFRDIQPLVASFLNIAVFVTPIFWSIDRLPARLSFLADLNPLYYMVEVIRAPLLGSEPPLSTWGALLVMLVLGGGITFALFGRFRGRIAYWL